MSVNYNIFISRGLIDISSISGTALREDLRQAVPRQSELMAPDEAD